MKGASLRIIEIEVAPSEVDSVDLVEQGVEIFISNVVWDEDRREASRPHEDLRHLRDIVPMWHVLSLVGHRRHGHDADCPQVRIVDQTSQPAYRVSMKDCGYKESSSTEHDELLFIYILLYYKYYNFNERLSYNDI